jgi:two-component system, OmpR family, KDP operon response regulator KdpE
LARSRSPFTGPARVLVVADEPVASVIALALNHGSYDVRLSDGVAAAISERAKWHPHLLIVDIDLRDGDPSTLVRDGVGPERLPIIVLAERGDLKTKLRAFDDGADDFLSVPISPEELVARALALMRRTYGETIPFVPVIKVGDLEIDLLNQVVRSGTSSLHLTSIEQSLLYLLASRPGETLDRESILDALWGSDYVAESNLVDRHIRNLRVKLKNNWRRPRYIATVPGKGYRFLVGP